MEIFLTVCKFAGLLISTLLGVFALVGKPYHEIEKPRLIHIPGEPKTVKVLERTKWGNRSLAGIMIGGAMGLAGLVGEHIIHYRESRASQIRTEQQIQLARTSLDQIEHLVTRFEDLNLTASFEFPSFGMEIYRLMSPEARSFISNPSNLFHGPVLTQEAESKNVVGVLPTGDSAWVFLEGEKGRRLAVSDYFTSYGEHYKVDGTNFAVPLSLAQIDELLAQAGFTQNESPATNLVRFLNSPLTSIRFWQAEKNVPQITNANMEFFAFGCAQVVSIEYLFPRECLRVMIAAEYPRSNWWHTASFASLPNLAYAHSTISLDNYYPKRGYPPSRLESLRKLPDGVSLITLQVEFNSVWIGANVRSGRDGYTRLPGREDYMPKASGVMALDPRKQILPEYSQTFETFPAMIDPYDPSFVPGAPSELRIIQMWPK